MCRNLLKNYLSKTTTQPHNKSILLENKALFCFFLRYSTNFMSQMLLLCLLSCLCYCRSLCPDSWVEMLYSARLQPRQVLEAKARPALPGSQGEEVEMDILVWGFKPSTEFFSQQHMWYYFLVRKYI